MSTTEFDGVGATTSLQWKELPTPSPERCDGSAALVQTPTGDSVVGIVFAGGRNSDTGLAVDTVEFLEWQLIQWWKLPTLQVKRYGCAIASVNDTVYVIGGTNPESPALDSAEQWQLGASSWQRLPQSMKTPRWFCAASAVSEEVQNRQRPVIFVAGGRDASWKVLNSVEKYDVEQQEWKPVAPMRTARFGCAVVSISPARIMVMGGFDGTNILSSCQAYNVNDDYWVDMPPMPLAMAFCSATTVTRDNRYVFVVGRTKHRSNNETEVVDVNFSYANNVIQCYSVESRKWKIIETSEMLEHGPILAIDGDLITIGKSPPRHGEMDHQSLFLRTRWTDLWAERRSDQTHVSAGNSAVYRSSLRQVPFYRTTSLASSLSQPQQLDAVVVPTATAELVSEHAVAGTAVISSVADNREVKLVNNLHIRDKNGKSGWYTGYVSVHTDQPHGKGRMRWEGSDEVYDGGWCEGHRHGWGITSFDKKGESYEGEYFNDKKQGSGTYTWGDGRKYQGKFVDDLREDLKGRLTWKDGTVYVGQFVRGQRQGKGDMNFPNGVWYKGDFFNDKYQGAGTFRFQNGNTYRGEWKAGQADGRGILTDSTGKVLHDGLWERDEPKRDVERR